METTTELSPTKTELKVALPPSTEERIHRFLTQQEKAGFSTLIETEAGLIPETQKAWIDSVGKRLIETRDSYQQWKGQWPENRKPESAGQLKTVDRSEKKAYQLSDFDVYFARTADKIYLDGVRDLVDEIKETIRTGNRAEHDSRIKTIVEQLESYGEAVKRAKEDYVEFTDRVVPHLKQAVGRINARAVRELRSGTYKGEVILGNGADPILWAVRASRWKGDLVGKTQVVEVDIGRSFLSGTSEGHVAEIKLEFAARIRKMLTDMGVRADAHWIDTGWYGHVPVALIRALDPEGKAVPKGEENQRISLLRAGSELGSLIGAMMFGDTVSRNTEGVEVLVPKMDSGVMELIDERSPRSTKSPKGLVETPSGIWTETALTTSGERIRAYAIKQAIVRSFLPKPLKIGPFEITPKP